MMRQKQKPFFSTLDEADLDLSDLETVKDASAQDLPPQTKVPAGKPQQGAAARAIPAVPAAGAAGARKIPEEPVDVKVMEERLYETVRTGVPDVFPEMMPAPDEAVPAEAEENGSPEMPVQEPVTQIEPVLVREAPAKVQTVETVSEKGAVRQGALSQVVAAGIETAMFVLIDAGRFVMGSPEDEPGRGDDETRHDVTLTRGFLMQAAPVTRLQWQAVMETSPSRFAGGGLDCPVEEVSWNDCQEFIRRLNKMGSAIYRLPTEAEWEYACRAGTGTAFYYGPITRKFLWRSDPCLDAIGWYAGNSGKRPHPVSQKRPNAWGLYDMLGNVCEWCQDWYGKYISKPQTDPKGPSFGSGCVVRGGSWQSETRACRSASRRHLPPNSRCDHVGFRLVRDR